MRNFRLSVCHGICFNLFLTDNGEAVIFFVNPEVGHNLALEQNVLAREKDDRGKEILKALLTNSLTCTLAIMHRTILRLNSVPHILLPFISCALFFPAAKVPSKG